MRQIVKIATVAFIILFSMQSHAQRFNSESTDNRKFEIGAMLGQPTGLVGKYWINPRSAIDVATAYAFGDGNYFELHGDYLFHFLYPTISQGLLPLYFGLGPLLKVGGGDSYFGLRLPIGAEYFFGNAPFSLFGEAGPRVEISPDTKVGVTGGVGARFVF